MAAWSASRQQGVLGVKQVALGPLAVEAGIFAFLLLVVVSSAVPNCMGRRPRPAGAPSASCRCWSRPR
jgi:hypothetical protein